MVNSKWFFSPGTTTFAHKVFISTTFVTQSFDLKMTYFRHRHFPDAIYSVKHNINILLYNIPQIDVCLRFQNL